MTKSITDAHTAILQRQRPPKQLADLSLRPNPNEFNITKSTPDPFIRTLSLD